MRNGMSAASLLKTVPRYVLRAIFLVIAVLAGGGWKAPSVRSTITRHDRQAIWPAVTPVQGRSWLAHLDLQAGQSPMGSLGGSHPPRAFALRREPNLAGQAAAGQSEAGQILKQQFVLGGADLYRISCQSCHGPNGQGAPPQVDSILPVAAALVGQPRAQAVEAFGDLLRNPGTRMPPYADLDREEIAALLMHLEAMAAQGRNEPSEPLVKESAARVGELVAKGTCHTCHDAAGPGGGFRPMMQRIVPSLASFPLHYSLGAVEYAVAYGSSSMMMMMRRNGAMPPLPYLTREETAATYLYLFAYPPQP
jgi:mono/diheme cytochrome c family protein